jgi:probable phosphoglycerate mutase
LAQRSDLLVVRHSETQWNSQARLQGHLDSPLTLNGIRQAMAVGETLVPLVSTNRPKRFWCSPLGRAQQTASILSGLWSVPFSAFTPVSALRERSYGAWEALTESEIAAQRPDELAAHKQDPWHARMEGGETKTELRARLEGWIESLEPDVLHVVITHSGCLRMLRGIYAEASPEQIETYREPQTASFLLGEKEHAIEPDQAMLERHGCAGAGRTVWI